jgi:predicted tellurium resistance membrane protein TerC
MTEGRREKIKIRIPIGRIINYLKENWGAPFIICFMILLMVAALFLAEGVELVANEIAVYAYYFLVAGVILQLICYLKYGPKEESDEA